MLGFESIGSATLIAYECELADRLGFIGVKFGGKSFLRVPAASVLERDGAEREEIGRKLAPAESGLFRAAGFSTISTVRAAPDPAAH